MADFTIRMNDRRPYLRVQLNDSANTSFSLVGALSVQFNMRLAGGATPKISLASCVVEDAAQRIVRYEWGATDTNTMGDYEGEIQVNWATGIPSTFPNGEGVYITIAITEEIA